MRAPHPSAALAAIFLVAGACGSSSAEPPPEGVAVAVSPRTATVAPLGTASFAATVTGSIDTGVTWSVTEAGGGSVSGSGLYTAPGSTGTFHVVATSRADPTRSDAATVTVQAGAQVVVTVSPPTATVAPGGTASFSATVTGSADTAVTWSVTEAGGGTVSSSGLYTAPGSTGTFHVVATSHADPSRSGTAVVTVRASGALFLDGFFPILVYNQAAEDFQTWKDLGVNGVQGPPTSRVSDWAASARALGLRQVRQPVGATGGNPPSAGGYASIASDPDHGSANLLAWDGVMPDGSGWDEIETSIGPYASTMGYAQNTADAIHAVDATRPVFLNSGINGLSDSYAGWPYTGGSYNYQGLFSHIDWVSNDIYPYGGSSYNDPELNGAMGGDHVVTAADVARYPQLAVIQGKGAIASIGAITDKLRAVNPSKAFFSFIEVACVTTSSPVVPAAAIRAEMWNAIIHGARGILIFAWTGQTRPTFSDGCGPVPAENRAELARQTALVTALAPAIQDVIDPPTMSVTLSHPALEAAWRDTWQGRYVFVQNTTNAALPAPATVTVTGLGGATTATVHGESRTVPVSGGVITDTFGPYAVHVYVVP